jgi:hypothetical protein
MEVTLWNKKGERERRLIIDHQQAQKQSIFSLNIVLNREELWKNKDDIVIWDYECYANSSWPNHHHHRPLPWTTTLFDVMKEGGDQIYVVPRNMPAPPFATTQLRIN